MAPLFDLMEHMALSLTYFLFPMGGLARSTPELQAGHNGGAKEIKATFGNALPLRTNLNNTPPQYMLGDHVLLGGGGVIIRGSGSIICRHVHSYTARQGSGYNLFLASTLVI